MWFLRASPEINQLIDEISTNDNMKNPQVNLSAF